MSKPKKVVDYIKLRTIKDNSNNFSALIGLKRVNNILKKFIKYGICGTVIAFVVIVGYNHYNNVMLNGIKNFDDMLSKIYDKRKAFYDKHKILFLDYSQKKDIDRSEDVANITSSRKKLIKNASGLVLETCKL